MDQQEEEASVSVSVSVPSSLPPEEEEEEEEQEEEEDDMGAVKMALGPQGEEEEQEDESLRRWKEQLLGPDALHTTNLLALALGAETVEPEVTILNLTILAPGRPDLVLPIPFVPDDKGHAFALKDGTAYSFRFSFTVSNNIVSGLKYSHTVWKTRVKVENQKVMLGTFSPQQEPYTYKAEEDSTPSGIFARGSYSARLKFVDDDGKVYLDMNIRVVDSLTRFACNEEGCVCARDPSRIMDHAASQLEIGGVQLQPEMETMSAETEDVAGGMFGDMVVVVNKRRRIWHQHGRRHRQSESCVPVEAGGATESNMVPAESVPVESGGVTAASDL
uniref:Rho GDP-dissociation inhibitor 1 n=1 Tax=Aegilops tauschii TaxID=37682 RepID=M8B630_AEGTA